MKVMMTWGQVKRKMEIKVERVLEMWMEVWQWGNLAINIPKMRVADAQCHQPAALYLLKEWRGSEQGENWLRCFGKGSSRASITQSGEKFLSSEPSTLMSRRLLSVDVLRFVPCLSWLLSVLKRFSQLVHWKTVSWMEADKPGEHLAIC